MQFRFFCATGRALFCVLIAVACGSHALPYGAHDARALAMGGTGVAAADNPHSAYFNPALLAAYEQRKHRGNNQRIIFPSVTGRVSEEVGDLIDIEDLDYDDRIRLAIDDYNSGGEPDDALGLFVSLDGDLRTVSRHPIAADLRTALVVTIPDRREGGAFTAGRRFILDGSVDYNSADAATVSDYVEELDAVADGAAPGSLHPELYRGGELIDPVDDLTSQVAAVGLVIDELAFSMAWSVPLRDTPLMLGITPKWARVTSYEYAAVATSSSLSDRNELDNGENFNLDLGYAQRIGKRWLLGVAVKDLISKEYETASGQVVEVEPQVRAGASLESVWGRYSLDLDLTENQALANGDPTRMLAVGAEWALGEQRLRAGLHKNLVGSGDNSDLGYSLGIRLQLFSAFVDLTLGQGASQQTAALQLGLRF